MRLRLQHRNGSSDHPRVRRAPALRTDCGAKTSKRSSRWWKLRAQTTVLSVLAALLASSVFGVSSAGAAVAINKYCSLHAYLPHAIATNRYEVSGAIECEFEIEEMEIEVWSEVWNPGQGKWFPITGTYSYETFYDTSYGGWQNAIDGVPGHEYRTADWGWVYDPNFPSPHYQSNTYHSSGWTCC